MSDPTERETLADALAPMFPTLFFEASPRDAALKVADAVLALRAASRDALAQDEFTAWFVKNYPGPETVINDPLWHAPRIFRAATYALLSRLPVPTPATSSERSPMLWALSDDEMPTDREWTDVEWLRNQLWLAQRVALNAVDAASGEARARVSDEDVARELAKQRYVAEHPNTRVKDPGGWWLVKAEGHVAEVRAAERAALAAPATQEGKP